MDLDRKVKEQTILQNNFLSNINVI